MPIFEDYSQNGELLQVRYETLNDDNFIRYLKVNGMEQTQGYLYALENLNDELRYGGYLYKLVNGKPQRHYGLETIGRKTKAFNEAKKELLKEVVKIDLNELNHKPQKKGKPKFVPSDLDPVSVETLPQFIKDRSAKTLKGYFDCITDISKDIDVTYGTKIPGVNENSLYTIGILATEVFSEKSRFHFRAERMLSEYILK